MINLSSYPQSTLHDLSSTLTAPLLFFTSEGTGWQDVNVQAYHEPYEIDTWIDPATPDTTLVLLTQGNMVIEPYGQGQRSQTVCQGEFFLKPSGAVGRPLRWRSLSAHPMQTLHIHLNTSVLLRTADELGVSYMTSLVGCSGFQDALLMQLGLSLWREAQTPTQTGSLYAQTAAQMMAVHLLRHYGVRRAVIKERTQGLARSQVARVTEFVQAHLSEALSLEDLAQQVGFSAYHFARLFRQASGQSPHQFVMTQRLLRAQHLLKTTELSLTQIALESGFANHSHFTQMFKRQMGMTPTAYREENRARF